MAGAYTLSRNAHVRGDVFYRLLSPRGQAWIDLIAYIFFLLPGVAALMVAGYRYAGESWHYKEVSVYTPIDIPIYPLKMLIPIAGFTLFIQTFAEIFRCIICLREGEWPARSLDVEEMESAIMHEREYMAQHQTDLSR
jgi:TRAP-type mannitol/chloroaromatic compound transport system permease small subunit